MKKRNLILIVLSLAASTTALVVAIFFLYMQAEEQQKTFFRDEVQRAGAVAVNKIDAVLEGGTSVAVQVDSSSVAVPQKFFQKFLRRSLRDTLWNKRVAVVKAVIDFEHDNEIIPLDTIYFDTLYKNSLKNVGADEWEADIDVLQYDEWSRKDRASLNTSLKTDSILATLLNSQFLYRVIMESLIEQGVAIDFSFALYNSYSSEFIVASDTVNVQKMLKSRYIFRLKNNGKFLEPHYLILHFPTERGFYFRRMSTIVLLISFFLLLILLIASLTLYALYRQKRVSEMKNDFINNMTHELKTPLATISLACEAMADDSILEDAAMRKSYVEIMRDETARLKDMVETVLRMARLQKGQMMMDVQKVDMHDLIQKVTKSISLHVKAQNGELLLDLAAEDYILYVDSEHMKNVLLNLVENAVKYSNENPWIRISTWSDKKNFYVAIKDKGIGISAKNQKHIFDDFFRVPTGNRHDVQGYGLGLSYVKKIVTLHGGSVSLKSSEGVGTEFVISLPMKKMENL